MSHTNEHPHRDVYKAASLYALAFSYRDYARECSVLRELYRRHCVAPLSDFLEVAAGPAGHALEMAAHGVRTAALDTSSEMVAYGRQQAQARGLSLDYFEADMVAFRHDRRFQLVGCLMDSASYLRTNDEVLRHLDAVADVMDEAGLYILELAHPAGMFGGDASTRSEWTASDAHGDLSVEWGHVPDSFDPLRQTYRASVRFRYRERSGRTEEIESTSEQRAFTVNEIDALVRASGRFRIVQMLGGFDVDLALAAGPPSWRMIPVLQKV